MSQSNDYYYYGDGHDYDNSRECHNEDIPSFNHDYSSDQPHFTNAGSYTASYPLAHTHSAPDHTTNTMRPQPHMVLTNFPYVPTTQPETDWTNSADTSFSNSSYTLFHTAGSTTYEPNQVGQTSYENSPSQYSLIQGEVRPDLMAVDPSQLAYQDHSTPRINEEYTAISPSLLTSSQPVLKKNKVASQKVKERADSKRKSSARFYCKYCTSDFTAKHNLQYHENSHEGKKLYPCPHCKSPFSVPRSRDRHGKSCKGRRISDSPDT
ncbi:hypothetical protein DFH05DRAFT_1527471 [Lentinula detonsa]|uniref:C2H2-type domain-containing protein n=1 Tax=Lentinula detonsa TaxID=2804962 RepID=A0A9W8TVC4_9AGAR|nr:hypothetical protein DFH05DRAFT_1527471 [Lentinula detonsa]